ncbi:hypothetical protein K4V16_10400 [Staphylococcus epidermidis]|nr:hypothetical protein [Staphylococcus epidermidis]
MAEIKTSNLSFKQINAIKILDKELKRDPFLLINFNELVNDLISERESFRKQRDELINDMAEVKRKAEAFDDILNVDYIVAPDDYAHEVTKIVNKYKECADHEK